MSYKVTLIPGDGSGPEVIAAAKRVVEATGVAIEWEQAEAGAAMIEKYGTPLPDETIESIRRNGVALKGPVTTPVGTGFRSVNVAMRKIFDLYANVRPAKTYPGVISRYDNIDLVVVRENTELNIWLAKMRQKASNSSPEKAAKESSVMLSILPSEKAERK